MPFKEVRELRKSGKLDEALAMANQDLEKDSDNIWNRRSLAWVYHDYLKEYASPGNYENFIDFLKKLEELDLPDDETMIFDTCVYQIGKMVFGFANDEHFDSNKIDLLFEHIKSFHLTRPSESYSFLFKAFHKCHNNWHNYIQFADWWDFGNFSSGDFLEEEFNGKKVMSLVEQAYIAYSKKLLEGEFKPDGGITGHKTINKIKIREFLPKLEIIIDKHTEYQYPQYFKAKLLLSVGDESEVLTDFLPFARKKRNDFWVWELLSDTFPAGDARKISCLCKALSLNTPDEFLINTRQKLAELLIGQGKFQEARTEIEKIVSARNSRNWRIPLQITEWVGQKWYTDSKSNKENTEFYRQHINNAEEILYSDAPEEIVVVEFVNTDKSIINFVKDNLRHGFFGYSNKSFKPQTGDLISVRFQGGLKNGFNKAFSVKKVPDDTPCDAAKEFQGNLKMGERANFGFVDDVFIDPGLIVKHSLKNNDSIRGKAILSFNKKKNARGWKAVTIF